MLLAGPAIVIDRITYGRSQHGSETYFAFVTTRDAAPMARLAGLRPSRLGTFSHLPLRQTQLTSGRSFNIAQDSGYRRSADASLSCYIIGRSAVSFQTQHVFGFASRRGGRWMAQRNHAWGNHVFSGRRFEKLTINRHRDILLQIAIDRKNGASLGPSKFRYKQYAS